MVYCDCRFFKNRSRGVIYSLFSFMILVTLIGFMSINNNSDIDKSLKINIDEKLRTDELLYFRDGAKQDFERSTYISGKRAVIALVDDVLRDGNYSSAYSDDSISELALYGTYENGTSTIMENSTINDWSSSIYQLGMLHRIVADIDVVSTEVVPVDAFSLNLSTNVNISVYGQIFGVEFNDTISSDNIIDVLNVEDPLISIESYGYLRRIITICNDTKYPYHVQKISTTGDFFYSSLDNWTSGRLSLDISDSNPSTKILVISDIPSSPNSADDFLGVISENVTDDSSGLSNYIFGATAVVSNFTSLDTEPIVVMDDGDVWSSYIYDELNESCYFTDPYGPSFLDRLEGNLGLSLRYNITNETVGIASLLAVTALPVELQNAYSAVDYNYFSEVSGKKIKGVTEIESGVDLAVGFLLDDAHVTLWGLDGLDYF